MPLTHFLPFWQSKKQAPCDNYGHFFEIVSVFLFYTILSQNELIPYNGTQAIMINISSVIT